MAKKCTYFAKTAKDDQSAHMMLFLEKRKMRIAMQRHGWVMCISSPFISQNIVWNMNHRKISDDYCGFIL